MRFSLWRKGTEKAQAARPVATPAPAPAKPAALVPTGDIDVHALGAALSRKRGWIIVPTVLDTGSFACGRQLHHAPIQVRSSDSDRRARERVPAAERRAQRGAHRVDAEAVTSQVQLVLSRDLAREIIKKNKLAERPEFDPVLRGISPVKSLLAPFGIGRDPFSMTPRRAGARCLFRAADRLCRRQVARHCRGVPGRDPELAAKVANSIAEGYLVLQQIARQEQARSASQWLSGEIENLRNKVSDAEARVEDFRSKSNLFVGTNNTTLSNQQMGELNTQLNNARALKSDAENRARLIREMLQSGRPIEASEVAQFRIDAPPVRTKGDAAGAIAEQSSTLLDAHPRIKELKAQIADIDHQISRRGQQALALAGQ